MVTSLVLWSCLVAIVLCACVAFAEWIHNGRIARIAYLAFGSTGRARTWAAFAPAVRCVGTALVGFGLVVLFLMEPAAIEKEPIQKASKHLLVCLDASPSMYVADSGLDGKKKRAVWAGEVIQAILDRLDTETTRVTVFAVYTKSIPVIEETFDMNVVRNLLDGLPLFSAFDSGPTRLSSGVNEALTYARKWSPGSATLVVISDGDSEDKIAVRSIPSSIADSIVIGVGDPTRPTMVSGHRSTQDTSSLKSLANKLKGIYHQGNNRHLPSEVLSRLSMIQPRIGESLGLREVALTCLVIGGSLITCIGPALMLFGRRRRDLPAVFVSRTNQPQFHALPKATR
jgi:Ca-activated chloride channel homolog